MNILLCAYACEPYKGSEPEVGWKFALEIAKSMPSHNIYVITKSNNKDLIEKEPYPNNITFFYYHLPKSITFWKKSGRGIRTYYYFWMLGAVRYIRKKNIKFDIVHHITFVNDWLPSFFSLLKSKKTAFIWGAIGSHDPIRFEFLDGKKRKCTEFVRIFLQKLFRRFDPFFYYSKFFSDIIIGINDNVSGKLRLKDKSKFISEPAIAIDKGVIPAAKKKSGDFFNVVSVGRLLYIKNFKLTVLSFGEFLKRNPNVKNARLSIVGKGDDEKMLKALVADLGIEKYVDFLGHVSRNTVQNILAESDLFLFPTLENAGFVILEAMSNGLPVLALDYGGPQQFIQNNKNDQLTNSNYPYEDIVDDLSKKIESLYFNNERAREIGLKNRQDVLEKFTWEKKAHNARDLYMSLYDER